MTAKYWRLLLFLCFVCAAPCICSLNGDCFVEEIDEETWKSFYQNNPIDDTERQLFKKFNTRNVKDVRVDENSDSKYISTVLAENVLMVKPTDHFAEYEVNEESTEKPKMTVIIKFTCNTGTAGLTFIQPIVDINSHKPKFNQSEYSYVLSSCLTPNLPIDFFGEEIVACDYDITNMELQWKIEPDDVFVIQESAPINQRLKCFRAVIVAKQSGVTTPAVYTITATDTGNPSLSTSTTLTIAVDEETVIPSNPYFVSPYYSGAYTRGEDEEKDSISFSDQIRLRDGNSDVSIKFYGKYGEHFGFEMAGDHIEVFLRDNLPEEVNDEPIVIITMEATLKDVKEVANTVLILYMPPQEITTTSSTSCSSTVTSTQCPICPSYSTASVSVHTCPPCEHTTQSTTIAPSTTECPPCPTTPTTSCPSATESTSSLAPGSKITFEKDNYFSTISSTYTGFILNVKATIVPQEPIKYTITEIDGETAPDSKLKMDENTGRLDLLEPLKDPKTYRFWAHAKGTSSKTPSRSIIVIDVRGDLLKTDLSLRTEYVSEREATNISICTSSSFPCTFDIVWQYPQNEMDLFAIEDGILQVKEISREMEPLNNMYQPQFTLTMQLKNSFSQSFKNGVLRQHLVDEELLYEEEREWLYLPRSIPNRDDYTILSIIVKDVNDPPKFEVGTNGRLVVGYPATQELIDYLAPPYLTKVYASDRDSGQNAVIMYNTSSQSFVVHPQTGVIYPGKEALNDPASLKFTVWATDNNGTEEGLSDRLDVEVKLLESDNLAIVLLENVLPEEMDDILLQISDATDVSMGYLSALVVSDESSRNSNQRISRSGVDNLSTRVVLYGLTEKNEPLKFEELKKIVEDSGTSTNIPEVESVQLPISNEGGITASSDVGYIVAVSILSFLLVGLMVAFGIFYYMMVYKPSRAQRASEYENMDDSRSVSEFDEKPKNSLSANQVSKNHTDVPKTWHERTSLPDEVENSEYEDTKKGVHFKETVRKINIFVDADEEKEDDTYKDKDDAINETLSFQF